MENTFVLIFSLFREYVMFDGIAEYEVAEREFAERDYLFLLNLFLFNDLI